MLDWGIPPTFIQYAADILADTNSGLSGSAIVRETANYAEEYHVNIPHPIYPYDAANKRTALYENLKVFSPEQQYRIIKELCDHRSFPAIPSKKRKELKVRLVTRYKHLAQNHGTSEVNETLIEETRHWLDGYPDAQSLYNNALEKYEHGVYFRNLLDDLRLALERLLRAVLSNEKSLENQISHVGNHITDRGGSKELANMFVKLIDYYGKYQNNYVKHNDAVIETEIEFILEITSSFMKHLIKLGSVE